VNVCRLADLVVVVMRPSDGQSEISRVFNFAILVYSQISRKLDARE